MEGEIPATFRRLKMQEQRKVEVKEQKKLEKKGASLKQRYTKWLLEYRKQKLPHILTTIIFIFMNSFIFWPKLP